MNDKILNFNAGPSLLLRDVLERASRDFLNYKGSGLSLLELSHRSSEYSDVHNETISLLRNFFNVPKNFHILFLGGGATLQFSMLPMNLLVGDNPECDFVISGSWAQKAYADAKKISKVNILFDGKESKYSKLPAADSLAINAKSKYLHLSSNETIDGVQWHSWPSSKTVPLVADMSSDILSRELPWDKFSLVYAGAQKNLGLAGATVVIIKDELLKNCNPALTAYLQYQTHVDSNSLYNTPPVFAIDLIRHNLKWLQQSYGSLRNLAEQNELKASYLYRLIDESDNYYINNISAPHRSLMNVIFNLKNVELEAKFIRESREQNMLGLQGHRSKGGIRASIYNYMTLEQVGYLAEFMRNFAVKNK